VHPLGKSPVITEGDVTVAESGAIIEYLIERHGAGRLIPPAGSARGDASARRPRTAAFLQRIHARPAYLRAVERGGPYEIMR
jgi:glutathione S-transferase